MVISCPTCSKEFTSGAQLNFHAKKAHSNVSDGQQEFRGSSEGCKKILEFQRRSSRLRLLRFGRIPGISEARTLQLPFRVTRSYLKISDPGLYEGLEEKRLKYKSMTDIGSAGTGSTTLVQSQAVLEDESDKDEVISPESDPTPGKAKTPSLEGMPILTPQSSPKLFVVDPQIKSQLSAPVKQDFCEPMEVVTSPPDFRIYSEKNSKISLNSSASSSSSHDLSLASVTKMFEKAIEIKWNSSGSAGSSNNSISSSSPPHSPTHSSASASSTSRGRRRKYPVQKCPVCGMTEFRTPYHFSNHLEVHEGKRPFVCPSCGFGYETCEGLLEHMSIRHSQDPAFQCDKCKTEYKTKKGFDKHKCFPEIPVSDSV